MPPCGARSRLRPARSCSSVSGPLSPPHASNHLAKACWNSSRVTAPSLFSSIRPHERGGDHIREIEPPGPPGPPGPRPPKPPPSCWPFDSPVSCAATDLARGPANALIGVPRPPGPPGPPKPGPPPNPPRAARRLTGDPLIEAGEFRFGLLAHRGPDQRGGFVHLPRETFRLEDRLIELGHPRQVEFLESVHLEETVEEAILPPPRMFDA